MRKILFSLAAGLLGWALTGTAHADTVRTTRVTHDVRTTRVTRDFHTTYYRDHAVRFAHGWYYPGRDHHHWERRVWDAGYRRWHYYDTGLRCWFYWHPVRHCYYPVGFICD
jgi:hypothetical protein